MIRRELEGATDIVADSTAGEARAQPAPCGIRKAGRFTRRTSIWFARSCSGTGPGRRHHHRPVMAVQGLRARRLV